MLKSIFLCADDFGLNPAINEGILALAHQGRLSATSCMTLAPAFAKDAATLAHAPIATGLHLSLTEPGASQLQAQTLGRLIFRSFIRQGSAGDLRGEIRRQLDAFEDHLHRAPDHVDGHQHVHTLPMIREALLEELHQRYGPNTPTVRSTRYGGAAPTMGAALKARVIEALGSFAMNNLAQHHGLKCTNTLLGVYSFDAQPHQYLGYLKHWMQRATPQDVIMCHPASSAQSTDPIGRQRAIEYLVLASPELGSLLKELNAQIA